MDKEKLNNEEVEAVEEVTAEEVVEETTEPIEEVTEEPADETAEETKELWKCADCDSVNDGESCLVCGAERPEDAEIYVETDEDGSVEGDAEGVEEDTELKKGLSKNTIIGIAAGGVVVIVLLIFAIFSIFGNMNFFGKNAKKENAVKYNDSYNKMYIDVEGKTLGELADESGYTVEEYKKINGLPADMGPDTNTNAMNNSISMREVVKKSGKEFSEFKEDYGWGDSVTEDSTVGEALGETKLRVILGVASLDEETAAKTLQEFKAYYGFGDEVTLDTLYKDIRTKIDEKAKEDRVKREKENEIYDRIEKDKGTIEDHATIYYNMTGDEFIAAYGLKGKFTKDSLYKDAVKEMTLKNYWNMQASQYDEDKCKYSDEKLEEFKAYYDAKIAEDSDAKKVEITADTTDEKAKEYVGQYVIELMIRAAGEEADAE